MKIINKAKKREYKRGQYVYHTKTGRVGRVEFFDKINRVMKLRLRKNISCEYNSKEIGKFRPYFGVLEPDMDGGFEDGYVDTIYHTESQCDKITFDVNKDKEKANEK